MSSRIKQICNSINREQVQSIRDLTSGHLNENHLYHPRPTIDGASKPCWSSSQKTCPTLRPPHRLQQAHSSNIEQMKDALAELPSWTLPEISRRKPPKPSKVRRYSFSHFLNSNY